MGHINKYSKCFYPEGYNLNKLDPSICLIDTDSVPAKKEDVGYDGYKHVKRSKISMLVDRKGSIYINQAIPSRIHMT